MKSKNLHLQFSLSRDTVFLVDHGAEPMRAYDLHDEFVFCVVSWVLRDERKPRKLNLLERLLQRFGWPVCTARNTRIVVGREGAIRVTVEHLSCLPKGAEE